MADFSMWRYCPYCGSKFYGGKFTLKLLEEQLANGSIVCGSCGCTWYKFKDFIKEV